MSVAVFVEAQVQPDKVADMKSYLAKIFPDTRRYDGNQGIYVQFNMDNRGNMVIVEQWESRGHYEKYLQWRTETGVFADIMAMLAGQPSIRYFEKADA